jgi:hypothetical protein
MVSTATVGQCFGILMNTPTILLLLNRGTNVCSRFVQENSPYLQVLRMFGWRGWNWAFSVQSMCLWITTAKRLKMGVAQATVVNKYAEARLFRGWFYADKISKYGVLPGLIMN